MKLGSLPKRLTYIQQVRGRSPVLLLDGGECFFGAPTIRAPGVAQEANALKQANCVLQGYNYIGYQAIALGPGDLQFGVDKLKKFLSKARFPVLCANLVEKESRQPVFASHTIIEAGGRRFGVYGVLLSSLNRAFTRRVLGDDYLVLDAEQTTRELVPRLRKECDVVIGLSHVNIADNERIARNVAGIDVLIDPFSRRGTKSIWIMGDEYVVDEFGTPILRIDGQGSRVGVFEMRFTGESGTFSDSRGYDFPLEPHIYSHPELVKYVNECVIEGRKEIPIDFDPTEVRLLEETFLGQEACGACHQKQHAFWADTRHSTAYATLEEDKRHLDPQCIGCHTLAYGLTFAEPSRVGNYKNVQCESCHGVEPLHAEDPAAHRFGAVREETCWACHNESITEKPFNYATDLEKVACPRMEY